MAGVKQRRTPPISGEGLVFGNFAIGSVERMASGFTQEFILRKFTPAAKDTGRRMHGGS
jgi:hypothetical protein